MFQVIFVSPKFFSVFKGKECILLDIKTGMDDKLSRAWIWGRISVSLKVIFWLSEASPRWASSYLRLSHCKLLSSMLT